MAINDAGNTQGEPFSNFDCDTDQLAHHYGASSQNVQYEVAQILIHRIPIGPGMTGLDIGCGVGDLVLHVAPLVAPNGSVTGIDPLWRRVEVARTKVGPNLKSLVNFEVGRGEDLASVADGSVDFVIMTSVFHWFEEGTRPRVLGEIFRVLKPGGYLGMTTGAGDHTFAFQAIKDRVLAGERYSEYSQRTVTGEPKFPTQDELHRLLVSAGFSAINIDRFYSSIVTKDADSMINHFESGTFGNFIGYLPEQLQDAAKDEMRPQFEKLRTDEGIEMEVVRLLVTVVKS